MLPYFLSQELEHQQQHNAGDAQEAHHQCGDEVDLEDDARQAAGQIQQPQADEARDGIDCQLPDELHLGQQQLDDENCDQHGDDQRKNVFHDFLQKFDLVNSIAYPRKNKRGNFVNSCRGSWGSV